MPPPANKIDPTNNVINTPDGVALDEDDYAGVDITTHTRQAWAASRASSGVDPHPLGSTTAGPPRASFTAPAGSGRGLLRNPIVSPYRPSTTSHHDQTPLRQTTISLRL